MAQTFAHMIKVIIISAIMFCGAMTFAQADQVCQTFNYNKSNNLERTFLLKRIKNGLIQKAEQSIVSIEKAQSFLKNCTSNDCLEFRKSFYGILKEQIHLAKITRAVAEKTRTLLGRSRSPRTVKEIIQRFNNKQIQPDQVANFNLDGFYFTDEDKKETLEIWFHIFVRVANKLPENSSLSKVLEETKKYFVNSSKDIIEVNPLLAFLSEENINDPNMIMDAFDKFIDFNKEFLNTINSLQTFHKTTFWSYPNLTIADHEMGLVNFNQQAMFVIDDYLTSSTLKNLTETDKGVLCSAWQDLKRQQTLRIRSSVGAGFASAVVCGVGIWWGVSTVPAAALCSLAFADGIWGARRGYLDSQLAHTSFYAGRDFFMDGTFAEGVLSKGRSLELENQGEFIMFINLIGIIPVVKAVAAAGRVGRGTTMSLFKLPASDITVSTIEAKSASMAYLMMAIRGLEAAEKEFSLDFSELELKIKN